MNPTMPLSKPRLAIAHVCSTLGGKKAKTHLAIQRLLVDTIPHLINTRACYSSQTALRMIFQISSEIDGNRDVAHIILKMYPPKSTQTSVTNEHLNPTSVIQAGLVSTLDLLENGEKELLFVDCAYKAVKDSGNIIYAQYLWQSLGFPQTACMEVLSHCCELEAQVHAIRSGSLTKERLIELRANTEEKVQTAADRALRTHYPTFQSPNP